MKNGRYIELKKNGNIYTQEYKNNILTDVYSFYSEAGNFFTGKRIGENEYQGVFYYFTDNWVDVGTFGEGFNLYGEGYKYMDGDSGYCTFENGGYTPSIYYECKADGTNIFFQ